MFCGVQESWGFMETEIKLLLDQASRTIVEAHPLFAATVPNISQNVSTYYDTPDLALRQRGVSLRVRQSGGRFVQTVKDRDGASGFASRGEWEWSIASEALDPGVMAEDKEALTLVAEDLDRVVPVFVTDIARSKRMLTLEDGTLVEAAIDEGEVRAGDRHAGIFEVELELKDGAAGPLFRLAADLARLAALRLGPDSKSERGYALLTDAGPPPLGATALVIADDARLGDVFPKLLSAACRDIAAELSGAGKGDIEGIHRLRAAIRKTRTLFVLFAPVLEPVATARFNAGLRDFGQVLGSGRDWDVFLTETLAEAEADLGVELVRPVREAAVARDRDAHKAVAAAVEGPLPTDLLLGLSLWTADDAWLAGDPEGRKTTADIPFVKILSDLLDKLEGRVAKRGRRLRSLQTDDLHDLRKALKKLRYACEDVSSLFKPKAVDRYLGACKKVLQALGRINDSAVTEVRIGELAPRERSDLAPVAASLLRWNAARRRTSERELRGRWRKFRRQDPFWS